jgi:hypothetical protein
MPTTTRLTRTRAKADTRSAAARSAPLRPAARRPAANALQRAVGNAAASRILFTVANGRVLEQKAPAVRTSFDDCPKNAREIIAERAAMARGWLAYTIRQLDSILSNPAKVDPDLHALLRTHFQVGKGSRAERALQDVATIRGRFAKIYGAFAKKIPFECESSCDDPITYGYVTGYWIFGTGDIHVCPFFFQLGYKEQTAGIIHEMAHKYADIDDKAYEWQPKYKTLSTEAAMNNADSYSKFARDI